MQLNNVDGQGFESATSLVQARTGITTNVAVPQRPVRKTALGAGMVVDGGRLDPSSPRSSGAGPYLPADKFRRLFEKFRGPVHGLPHS